MTFLKIRGFTVVWAQGIFLIFICLFIGSYADRHVRKTPETNTTNPNSSSQQQDKRDCGREFWMLPCHPGPRGVFIKQARTLNDCKNLCKSKEKCKGFNWLPIKNKCWLTSTPGKFKPRPPELRPIAKMQTCSNRVTHFEAINNCTKEEMSRQKNECSSSEFWVVPCLAGSPGKLMGKGLSFPDCVSACRNNPTCKGFDRKPITGECWLSEQASTARPVKPTVKLMRKVKNCKKQASHFELIKSCNNDRVEPAAPVVTEGQENSEPSTEQQKETSPLTIIIQRRMKRSAEANTNTRNSRKIHASVAKVHVPESSMTLHAAAIHHVTDSKPEEPAESGGEEPKEPEKSKVLPEPEKAEQLAKPTIFSKTRIADTESSVKPTKAYEDLHDDTEDQSDQGKEVSSDNVAVPKDHHKVTIHRITKLIVQPKKKGGEEANNNDGDDTDKSEDDSSTSKTQKLSKEDTQALLQKLKASKENQNQNKKDLKQELMDSAPEPAVTPQYHPISEDHLQLLISQIKLMLAKDGVDVKRELANGNIKDVVAKIKNLMNRLHVNGEESPSDSNSEPEHHHPLSVQRITKVIVSPKKKLEAQAAAAAAARKLELERNKDLQEVTSRVKRDKNKKKNTKKKPKKSGKKEKAGKANKKAPKSKDDKKKATKGKKVTKDPPKLGTKESGWQTLEVETEKKLEEDDGKVEITGKAKNKPVTKKKPVKGGKKGDKNKKDKSPKKTKAKKPKAGGKKPKKGKKKSGKVLAKREVELVRIRDKRSKSKKAGKKEDKKKTGPKKGSKKPKGKTSSIKEDKMVKKLDKMAAKKKAPKKKTKGKVSEKKEDKMLKEMDKLETKAKGKNKKKGSVPRKDTKKELNKLAKKAEQSPKVKLSPKQEEKQMTKLAIAVVGSKTVPQNKKMAKDLKALGAKNLAKPKSSSASSKNTKNQLNKLAKKAKQSPKAKLSPKDKKKEMKKLAVKKVGSKNVAKPKTKPTSKNTKSQLNKLAKKAKQAPKVKLSPKQEKKQMKKLAVKKVGSKIVPQNKKMAKDLKALGAKNVAKPETSAANKDTKIQLEKLDKQKPKAELSPKQEKKRMKKLEVNKIGSKIVPQNKKMEKDLKALGAKNVAKPPTLSNKSELNPKSISNAKLALLMPVKNKGTANKIINENNDKEKESTNKPSNKKTNKPEGPKTTSKPSSSSKPRPSSKPSSSSSSSSSSKPTSSSSSGSSKHSKETGKPSSKPKPVRFFLGSIPMKDSDYYSTEDVDESDYLYNDVEGFVHTSNIGSEKDQAALQVKLRTERQSYQYPAAAAPAAPAPAQSVVVGSSPQQPYPPLEANPPPAYGALSPQPRSPPEPPPQQPQPAQDSQAPNPPPQQPAPPAQPQPQPQQPQPQPPAASSPTTAAPEPAKPPTPISVTGAPARKVLEEEPPVRKPMVQHTGDDSKNILTEPSCSKEFWMIPCMEGENPAYFMPKSKTLNDCMGMCHKNSRCKGFDWKPSEQKCWAMKDVGKKKPKPMDREVMTVFEACPTVRTHFEAVYRCNCTYQFMVDPCHAGHAGKPEPYQKTVEECLDLCQINPSCTGINYHPERRECALSMRKGSDLDLETVNDDTLKKVQACSTQVSGFRLTRDCGDSEFKMVLD